MRSTFKLPDVHVNSNDSQFDRQESENQKHQSDDDQVKVEEINLIAEGMK